MSTDHALILGSATQIWRDEDACAASAAALARVPTLANAYVELRGELGAGKTTWVRHLLRALGVQGRVKSPTYAVLESYDVGGLPISHFDFYRFSDPREWLDAGFREPFSQPGLKLAEWPEQAEGVLPTPDLRLHLTVGADGSRCVTAQALSPAGLHLLPAFADCTA